MSVLDQLATSLRRKDEIPNQELASKIIAKEDLNAIEELIIHLKNHKDKKIQSDCIKVLYEVGELKPELIENYTTDFLEVLHAKNNRLVWGAMTALDTITTVNPKTIFENLTKILKAMDKGSVITKDHGIGILIKLSSFPEYHETTFPLLTEQLISCPFKQVPMYAERALEIINTQNKETFIKILNSRLPDMEKDSQKKRIEKVIQKVDKK